MKKIFLLLLALLILLMVMLPVTVSAEGYSSEPTDTVPALQQPAQKPQPSTTSKVLWLIVVGPPVLIMLGVAIAIRVKQREVWFKYLRDKLGVEDEEEY